MKKKIILLVFVIFISYFLIKNERANAADARTYFDEGMAFLNREEYDKAIESLRKAIRENSNIPQLYNALGYALLKKNGTVKSASKAFEKAIELDPTFADPYFNLGTYYAGPGQDAILAGDYFEKAIKANPNFSKAHMGLGWMYLEKKDIKKAIEHFKKAVEIDPGLAEAQYGLGLTYVAMRKSELALKPITNLRAVNRNDLALAIEAMIQHDEPTGIVQKELSETGSPATGQPAAAPGGPANQPSPGPARKK